MLERFHPYLRPIAAFLATYRSEWFYVVLAIVMAIWTVGMATQGDESFPVQSYDRMMSSRFLTPQPDPDIVILNIDEKSLAQMSQEFGRWPWPRDVLASVLVDLERQGAKAIVFDILFSDPDTLNPAGDKAFSDAIALSAHSFFPVLRLNPSNDSQSSIFARQMYGLTSATSKPAPDKTLALVVPYFATAVKSGRLGTHNLMPDKDNILRRYSLWEEIDGWRISSLPQRLAIDLNWPAQHERTQLLQWMEKPMSYKTISFSDYYLDTQLKARTRPLDEFRGKIVLIGATAASLFDIKATPIASVHSGIDVLATAVDNTKNDRFIQVLPRWSIVVVSAIVLGFMAWLSIRYSHEDMALAFVVAPTILLSISYLCLNFLQVFIDLSSIASLAFLYFSIVKIHSKLLRSYWSGDYAFTPEKHIQNGSHFICLTFVFPANHSIPAFEPRLYNIMRRVAPTANVIPNLERTFGWMQKLFQRTVVVTWLTGPNHSSDVAKAYRQSQEVANLLSSTFLPNGGGNTRIVERRIESTIEQHGSFHVRSAILSSLKR